MVQLIKKGGLRERANRSRRYQDSENLQTTLKPNTYQKSEHQTLLINDDLEIHNQCIKNQPKCKE